MMVLLQNKKCCVEYKETEKQFFGQDFTDRNNDPAFYTKSKRGLKNAWAAINTKWTETTTMHDVLMICQEFKIKTHYWCMVD